MSKQRVSSFLEKYDCRIGVLALVFVMFFTHAPFFLYIPVPGISMDTFQYFWFAKQIFEGAVPVIKQPVEIPWGYPFFLYITKLLNLSIVQIVFMQTIFFLLACSWTVSKFSKHIKYGGVIAGTALVLFILQPHTIRHNVTLYSESLYTSALILICGSMVTYLYSQRFNAFIFLVFSIWCAMLIRPNGILLLSIPFFFILQTMLNGGKTLNYVLVFVSALLLDIAGNFYFKGKCSIGDSDRITHVINNLLNRYSTKAVHKSESKRIQTDAKMTASKTPGEMFSTYFLNFITAKPSFYYSIEATNYNNLVINNMPDDTTLRMFDSRVYVDSFCTDLRLFIFKGYPHARFNSLEYSSNLDYNMHKNKWMYATHLVYELINKLKFHYIIYLMFWLTALITFYKYFINAERGAFQQLNLLLAFIHFLSLFLLPFMHGRFQLRYIHVSEFIVFLNAVLGVYYYFPRYSFYRDPKINLKSQG